jgi:hypothetical protein
VTNLDHVFVIQNQGTQEVEVSVNDVGRGSGTVTYYDTANSDTDSFPATLASIETDDGEGAVTLGVGESVSVGIQVDTTTGDNIAENDTPTNMDVTVEATAT